MPRIDNNKDFGGGTGGGVLVEVDPLSLKLVNNLSDVPSKPVALNTLLPTQSAGKILESDGVNVSFQDKPQTSTLTTTLSVTGSINSGVTLSAVSSGVSYTKTGDNGFLGNSSTDFANFENIQIYLNGLLLEKGADIIYISSSTFSINKKLHLGEKIIIFS